MLAIIQSQENVWLPVPVCMIQQMIGVQCLCMLESKEVPPALSLL